MKTKFGEISSGTYQKSCKHEHFMIKYNGFGISQSELDLIKSKGGHTIIIKYFGKKSTIIYKSKLDQWFDSNKIHVFGEDDVQKFLSIKDMEIIYERQEK